MPRARIFFLFLLVFIGVLCLGNFIIYDAGVLAFSLTGTAQLLLLMGLSFLSISFVVATIIGNRHYNLFTRTYYTLSAVWMGFFVYLFLASIIYDVLVFVSPSFLALGPALFFAVLLLGIYGIVHSRKIIIRKISVTLPKLPSSWKGKKAVWISDLHLGQIHGPKFAQKIIALISKISPDIIFIGGDLFDGSGASDLPELTAPLKKLSAPFGVYFIAGNHEEYGNRKKFLLAVESAGMRVLEDEMVEIDGLQLIGVDYQHASDATRFRAILSKLSIRPDMASILLKHEPKDLDVAQMAGVSFQISGHTHKAQLWPLNYIAQLTYKGFSYGLKRFKDMQVYTSSGTGTWGPPMRVGTDSEIVVFTFE